LFRSIGVCGRGESAAGRRRRVGCRAAPRRVDPSRIRTSPTISVPSLRRVQCWRWSAPREATVASVRQHSIQVTPATGEEEGWSDDDPHWWSSSRPRGPASRG